jgi:cyclopropane fatty-acyl-phospholipid synthase-like methyltransferase
MRALRLGCAALIFPAVMSASQPLTPADLAAKWESPSQAVFRYRVAIAGLLNLQPGMTAAEVGATTGFVARAMAPQVAAAGRAIAVVADEQTAAFVRDRARTEGAANVTVVVAKPGSSGLDAASVDAIAMADAFSAVGDQRALLRDLSMAIKPGGALLIVDFAREGQGAAQAGIDADDVVALATAAGFRREAESSVVPGHYALRFRKPAAS